MPAGDRLPLATLWLQLYSCRSKSFDKDSGKPCEITGDCRATGAADGEAAASVRPLWVPCMDPIRILEGVRGGEDAEAVGAAEHTDGALAWDALGVAGVLKSTAEVAAPDTEGETPPCTPPELATGCKAKPPKLFILPAAAFLYEGDTGGLICVFPLQWAPTEDPAPKTNRPAALPDRDSGG